MNPDVVGLSEVDVLPLYREIAEFMASQGYSDYFVEKSNRISGSAIFFKSEKFKCLSQNSQVFGETSQFFMYVKLQTVPPKGNGKLEQEFEPLQFVFGETHLKAKKAFIEDRKI